MNPDKYIHTVSVQRGSTWTTVIAALKCLIEPVKPKSKQWVFGLWPLARYRMSWGLDDVRPGDRVTVTAGPVKAVGKTFSAIDLGDDTGRFDRLYQTILLEELK